MAGAWQNLITDWDFRCLKCCKKRLMQGSRDGEAVQRIFEYFGFRVCEREVKVFEEMRKITDSGGIVATTMIAGDWDKRHRSGLQSYDSHWVVVPAVDARRVVVMDSDIREAGVGTPAYGVYTMEREAFMGRVCDFEHVGNGFISPSEDFVWGISKWYGGYLLEVRR